MTSHLLRGACLAACHPGLRQPPSLSTYWILYKKLFCRIIPKHVGPVHGVGWNVFIASWSRVVSVVSWLLVGFIASWLLVGFIPSWSHVVFIAFWSLACASRKWSQSVANNWPRSVAAHAPCCVASCDLVCIMIIFGIGVIFEPCTHSGFGQSCLLEICVNHRWCLLQKTDAAPPLCPVFVWTQSRVSLTVFNHGTCAERLSSTGVSLRAWSVGHEFDHLKSQNPEQKAYHWIHDF